MAVMKLLIVLAFALPFTGAKPNVPRVNSSDEIEPLSDRMVSFINSLNTTWKAGHNWAPGFQVHHLKRLLGLKLDGLKEEEPIETLVHVPTEIPEFFDVREEWPQCPSVRQIRDQGACGSCWAFGAVEAMSDRTCIATNGSFTESISAEDLLSCCGFFAGCGFGCNGGNPWGAWNFWKTDGLVTGGLYHGTGCRPYSIEPCSHQVESSKLPECAVPAETPSCDHNCVPEYVTATYSKDKIHGKQIYTLSSAEQMQLDILKHGPIEVGYKVYSDFPSYKSGVYQRHSDDELGGHAVKLLGWGVDDDVPYWLAANSWNTEWGDNGYFKIRRGVDECGIESMVVVAGIPDV